MIRFSVIGASALALSAAFGAPANAQTYEWTGFYAGINAGYGWGKTKSDVSEFGNWTSRGPLGGVQFGYNWGPMRTGSILIGLEADAMIGSVNGHGDPFFDGKSVSMSTDMHWISTARVRVGMPFDRFLVYGTGGLAMGQWQNSLHVSSIAGSTKSSDTQFSLGWAAGAGMAYGLPNSNWSLKAEYLYMDFGKEKYSFQGDPIKVDQKFNVFRVGLDYKFAP